MSDPILWEVAYPEVAVATDGSFVITWTSYRAAGRYDVYARRFSAQGEPQGNEFRVNDQTDADQLWPDVALGPDGGFVITWDDFASTGDVWARRYGPSGTPLGTQFRVNTHLPRLQVRPSIASDEEGRFVVVWASSDQDGHVTGIYAQRFSADGERIGEEFRVNANTYHYQDNPELHVNPDGSFAIVWMSFAQDGSNYGVFAQAYDRLGAPVGEEFQVNTYTQGDQQFPSVTGGNGTLVIVWTSGVQDGSSSGVYGQRYAWEGVHIEAPSDARTAISARPNPANGLATATLSLAEPSAAVKVAVLDVLGRQMMVLHDGPLAAGTHRLSVDVSAWPVGVYVLRAEGVGAALAQRFTVVR